MTTQLEQLEHRIDTAYWALARLQALCQTLDLIAAGDDLGGVATWLAVWLEKLSPLRSTQAVKAPDALSRHVIPF